MTMDDRSLSGGVPDSFDFDTPAGILAVLRAIRLADIASADKNTLKDLVFLYNTGAKDEAVKQKLIDALAMLEVTPHVATIPIPTAPEPVAEAAMVTTETPEVKPVLYAGFGSGRRAPVFVTPPVAPEPTQRDTTPLVSETVDTVPTPPVPTPVPTVLTDLANTSTAIPVRKISPVIQPVIPSAPVPIAAPASTIAPVTETASVVEAMPVPVSVASAETPVPPTTAPTSDADPQARAQVRMERIRTIKSTVNDRIGNPVNLVDVDNNLGREYMSALLQAMKLLTDASESESAEAMNRLETVYQQVMALLDEINTKERASAPVAVQTPIAPIMPTTPVADQTVVPEVVPTVPTPSVVEKVAPVMVAVPVPAPVTEPLPSATSEEVNIMLRSKVSEKPDTSHTQSGWDTHVAPESAPVVGYAETVAPVQSVASMVTVADQTVVERLSTPPAPPLREVADARPLMSQPEPLQSVGEKEPPLRSLSELKTADEVSAIEAMSNNPLYTKDVDAGLEQLLGEWSIFKKSGLFGTGPKGREHPLYVKISGMQVPLILSGRFEGSTQEIKQSITDYMNGWRYEQGIVYENNETLDQYLRRVIRHIIDLQKNKRRS